MLRLTRSCSSPTEHSQHLGQPDMRRTQSESSVATLSNLMGLSQRAAWEKDFSVTESKSIKLEQMPAVSRALFQHLEREGALPEGADIGDMIELARAISQVTDEEEDLRKADVHPEHGNRFPLRSRCAILGADSGLTCLLLCL
jgi:hypothetical protein